MFQSKYGVARHIYIPVPKAGSANHAVGADWTPAAGDVKISKDGGAAANVTNLPTAIAMGNSAIWDFSLTATEMEAAQVDITVADSATKAVDDTGFIIETYGHASGQHAFDLDTASSAQTGDSYAVVNSGTFGNSALKTLIDAIDDFVDTEVAAIKAKTDNLPADPADASDIAAALTIIDDFLDTEIADIRARIPAALTADGNMKSDALRISGSATAADNLEGSALGIIVSAVNDAAATTTGFVTDLTEATNDHYNGRIIVFTSGALAGQATDITDYVGATKAIVCTALTEAPADNDVFVMV